MNYIYAYEGACGGPAAGNAWINNSEGGCATLSVVIYSAGTALRDRKLIVAVYAKLGDYSSNLNDYLWNNVSYRSQPLTLGL